MAYLEGLGPRVAPQVIGNLRADLKAFAESDFKDALKTLCGYVSDMDERWLEV